MTAREYLNELDRKRNEAGKDKSSQGKKRSNQLGRRRSLVYRATQEGVESADLLSSLTENLIYDWALPDDKVKTFKDAVSVVWHDAEDDNGDETVVRHWSRRWSLVHMAVNDGVKSVRQLQNLIENLSHQWTLPDDKIKTFKEAVSVEWHDAETVNGTSKQNEILTNRLSRRWSLVHTAINDGVGSVEDLQHLLLHLTHNWKLSDGNVKTFKAAASVEWHDAQDLNDSVTQQLSRRWSDIHSKIIKGCSSVKKIQRELNMVTTDDIDGSYDDYIVDATSLSGMSKKSNVASKSSHRPESEPGIQITSNISNSNLKTKDMNNNQSDMANAIEKQIKALKEGPIFNTEYMVYFDPNKAEGPYNDVYMFCYIKHNVITPDTLIAEKGKTSTMRAGDCKELEDFFNLFETGDKEDLSDDIQEVSEESDLGGNIPKMLLNLYFDNKDLFEEVDGADEALDHIHELSVDVDKLNKNHDRMFFSIDDMECYLKENLTDSQNAVVKRMVKETYRFLLHTKWNADLPAELVDLTVEVAELFDDSFSHIDNILRGAYKMRKNSSGRDVDGILHFLEGRFVDDAIPTPNQEKILRQIAEIMYAFIHPQEETPEEALHKAWDEKLSKSLIDNFIENADLFNNENGSELIDEDILESIYTQTESFNLEEAEVHFQVSDLEGYANEELTDKQSVELKKLARKVFGFLLHRKWDETLPPKMIDLIIEVADLFDDSYDEKYIDRKICVFTYNLKGDDSFEIDDFTDRLEGILVDDVTPTAEQENILHEIAVMMHNYVNS